MVQGRASGKIILMGEHAVVYGQPAIALPFSAVGISVTVTERGTALSVSCAFYEGLVHEMPKIWESLKHAIRFSLYRIGAPSDHPIHIQIDHYSCRAGDGVKCGGGSGGGQGPLCLLSKGIEGPGTLGHCAIL